MREFGLKEHVSFVAYVPHKDVLRFQRSAQVLLLAVNNVPSAKSLITGKVFEYLQSQRPVIGIGPVDGDLAAILNETGAGQVVDFEDLVFLFKLVKNRSVAGDQKLNFHTPIQRPALAGIV